MKILDMNMEKRVGGLERHFRDGISRLLIDNGVRSLVTPRFLLGDYQEWQQGDRGGLR